MITNNCGVYKITNTITGDYYIGSSDKIKERIQHHIHALNNGYHRNPYLLRAWNKYGEKAFEFTVILLCDVDHKLYFEQGLLNLLKPVYNIATNVSAPTTGLHRSEETRAKISEANRRRIHSPCSEETKRKLSIAMTGKHPTEEQRSNISAGLIGKHRTEEQKCNMSAAQILRRACAKTKIESEE